MKSIIIVFISFVLLSACSICEKNNCPEELHVMRQFAHSNKGKYGYVDRFGGVRIMFKFEDAYNFSNNLAVVANDDKYGFINREGKVVVPLKYDFAWAFGQTGFEELALVNYGIDLRIAPITWEGGGVFGFINEKGEEVLPLKYGLINDASEGLAAILDGEVEIASNGDIIRKGKWGYINENAKIIIPLIYDDCDAFKNGKAVVLKGDKWGLINKKGEIVIPFKYTFIENKLDKPIRMYKGGTCNRNTGECKGGEWVVWKR